MTTDMHLSLDNAKKLVIINERKLDPNVLPTDAIVRAVKRDADVVDRDEQPMTWMAYNTILIEFCDCVAHGLLRQLRDGARAR